MNRANLILILIIILSLAIRTAIAWQPVPVLIEKILLDDSLYGYATAKNLAAGNFLTYNGVDMTNGVQVLWILLITPVYLITSDINLSINAILTIQAVIDTLVVFLIFKLGSEKFNKNVGLLASFIWAFNPMIFFQTMSGIDVTIYIFFVLTSLLYYDRIKDKLTVKNVIPLGILLGLTFLSRGDGVFLFIVIAAQMILKKKVSVKEYVMRAFSKKVLAFAAITFLTVSPWLLWNYSTFGTLQQSSFLANYLMNRGIIPFYDLKPPTTLSESLSMIGESFLKCAGVMVNQMGVIDFFSFSLATLILVPFLILTMIALVKNWKKIAIPFFFSILLLLFYGGYLLGVNIRYLTPLIPFLTILEAVGILEVAKMKPNRPIFYALLLILSATLFYNGIVQWDRGYVPWQGEIYKDALWLKDNTPSDAVIASFASGNIIYFSNRTTIGMDGVVDYKSIDVILNKSVYSYWKRRNVTYWVESSYHNQTAIDQWRNGQFDILKENQWRNVFEPGAKFELVQNRCDTYYHMRGFDMLVCFFIARVN